MIIKLKITGGLHNRNETKILDTKNHDYFVEIELRKFLNESNFFILPRLLTSHGNDLIYYTLEVEDRGRKHKIITDFITNEYQLLGLRRLINYMTSLIKFPQSLRQIH